MPVLIVFVFGIIGFGLAFMQMQTIRGALREGGRAAATGASADEVQDDAYQSALGAIDSAANVDVDPNTGGSPVCTPQTIGEDATVSYDTATSPMAASACRSASFPSSSTRRSKPISGVRCDAPS